MHDYLRRDGFEIAAKPPLLLEPRSKLGSNQAIDNAWRDPASDIDAALSAEGERHVSGESPEHGAKHVEGVSRWGTLAGRSKRRRPRNFIG
jgi:hypothetical protein